MQLNGLAVFNPIPLPRFPDKSVCLDYNNTCPIPKGTDMFLRVSMIELMDILIVSYQI